MLKCLESKSIRQSVLDILGWHLFVGLLRLRVAGTKSSGFSMGIEPPTSAHGREGRKADI